MSDAVPQAVRSPISLGSWLLGEMDAIVSQDRIAAIRQGFQCGLQEIGSGFGIRLLVQLGLSAFGDAVDRQEEASFAFGGSVLGAYRYIDSPADNA